MTGASATRPARLHLVDGTYELFRAHYSKRPARTAPDGRDVKATVGLVSSLLGLLEDEAEAVSHLGVAFDNPITSWRNDRFDGYKDGGDVDPTCWPSSTVPRQRSRRSASTSGGVSSRRPTTCWRRPRSGSPTRSGRSAS